MKVLCQHLVGMFDIKPGVSIRSVFFLKGQGKDSSIASNKFLPVLKQTAKSIS